MKLYRVEYSGFACVEADSEEEAKEYYRELCNYGEETVDNIYFEGEILD